MPGPVTVTYDIYSTSAAVALAAARLFADAAANAVSRRGTARVAISGGTTPKAMFALLADPAQPFATGVDWAKLQLFWVDERCVPPTDADSNYRMTDEALLSKVSLPAENVHRMEGELPPEEAAARYESTLRNTLRLEGAETPVFDLVLLGMGEDGHTASLFPHTAGLHELSRLVIANHVAAKDAWRVSLTSPVINAAREVSFLIEGASKAAVLAEVLAGPRDPERLPSQMIRPASGALRFLLDEAAAAKLPLAGNALTGPEGSHKVGTLEL